METTNKQSQEQLENMVKAGKDNAANGQAAHSAAEADIQNDPDLADKAETGDDLDEGELARLDGEK